MHGGWSMEKKGGEGKVAATKNYRRVNLMISCKTTTGYADIALEHRPSPHTASDDIGLRCGAQAWSVNTTCLRNRFRCIPLFHE